jgi:hypothetical protein
VAPVLGPPSGTVTITAGSEQCSATVGQGQCTLTFATPGQRTINAHYAGNGNYLGSTSAAVTLDVRAWKLYLPLARRT